MRSVFDASAREQLGGCDLPTPYVGRRALCNTLAGKTLDLSLRQVATLPIPGGPW